MKKMLRNGFLIKISNIARAVDLVAVIGVLTLILSACSSGHDNKEGDAGLRLRQEAEKTGLIIGAGATNPAYLDDPQFAAILGEQFNSLSPENELKWSFVQPQQGEFNFAGLDRIVDYAQQHNMAVKGHGLISGCCNPKWLRQIQDPDELRAAMATHFGTIMTRYAGKMDRWDVVTEPFSIGGGTGLNQESYFYHVLGPDYIADAFNIAHTANPDAKLFLNESLVESIPAKRKELYDLVANLVSRNVPITGVGLEMHIVGQAPPPGVITDIVNEYNALGLEVAITEMDVHVQDRDRQANIYTNVLKEALDAGIRDISFWGFTDKYMYPYFPGDTQPLLLDENYIPKPAYDATLLVLQQFALQHPMP